MNRKLLHLLFCSFSLLALLWSSHDLKAQSVRMPVTGVQTTTAQGTVIYDNGGASRYSPNAKGALVVMPAFDGGRVTLNFSVWDIDCQGDYLYVYDGIGVSDQIIGVYDCRNVPQIIQANAWNITGALTLRFISDNAVEGDGFVFTATTACGAGVALAEKPYVVSGGMPQLKLVGDAPGSIRWESTTDYGRTWIPIFGVYGKQIEAPAITQHTQYRAVVECAGGSYAYSTITAVQVLKIDVKQPVRPKKDDTPEAMLTCAQDFPNNPVCQSPPFNIQAAASPQTICQGQSSQLTAAATGQEFFDDFTSNTINCQLWNCSLTNGRIGTRCGTAPPPASGGNTMYFDSTQPLRRVTTQPQNTQDGGSISFWIRLGAESNTCESPDICGQEEVFLEYSIDGGNTWIVMQTFGMSQGQNCTAQSACTNNNGAPVPLTDCNPWRGNFVFMNIPIPPAARTPNTLFRFRQNLNSGGQFDNWALDDVRINIGTFNYTWAPANTLNNPNINNPVATPTTTTTYSVVAISQNGNCCLNTTIQVTVNPTNPGTVSANQTICSGQTPANFTLTGNTGPVIRWEATTGLCPQTNWSQIFTNVTSYNPGQLTNNNQTPIEYTYRAVTQPQGCGELFSNCVTVVVNPTPQTPNVLPNPIQLCLGQTGGQVSVQPPVNGTYLWYTVPNGGTSIANGTTFTIPPPTQATVYYVENIVNGCTSSRRPVTVTITTIQAPQASGGTFCRGQQGAQVCVTNPQPGETYRWFDQQVGGTLLGTGTCFNNNGTIANTNGTFSYFVERIANACTSTRTQVVVNVSVPAGPTANNVNACTNQTGVNLCVNNPINGTTYLWYTVPNGGTPVANGTCYNNVPTGQAGTFTFYVEAVVNACTSSRGQVRLTVSDLPAPTPFEEPTVCPGETADLFAGTPNNLNARFFWYDVQNGGTPLNNPAGDVFGTPFTTPPITADPTCFYLEYTLPGGCRSPRTRVCVFFNPNTPPRPTPLFTDSVICEGDFVQMRLTAPQNGFTFTWRKNGQVVGTPNRTFPAAETLINLPIGTHVYEITASAGSCVGPPATVTITVAPAAVAGDITGPASVCTGQPATLTLQNHDGIVQNWERNINNAGWSTMPNSGGQTSVTDPSVTQPTCYRATVGPCNPATTAEFCVDVGGGNLNPGQAQVQTSPTPPPNGTWASNRVACGNFTPTIRLTGHTGTIVRWESGPDNTTFDATVTTMALTTITSTLSGTQMCFRAIVSSVGCGEAPSQPACVNIDNVSGDLAQDLTICEGGCTGALTLSNVAGDIAGWQSTTNIVNGNCVWSGNGFVNPVLNNQSQPELGTSLSRCGLTQTTCYRARIQSALFPDPNACATLLTNEIRVTVRTPSAGGTVASSHTICEGANSQTMSLSGHNGTVVRWEFDTNGDQNWVPISTTATTYQATGLTAGRYCFRAAVQNDPCPIAFSNPACVQVDQPAIGGNTSAAQTVCQGSNAQGITLTGHRATVQTWQRSTDGGNTFSNITGSAGLTTLTPALMGAITQATCFRAVIASGVCPTANSGITCIDIDLPSQGGTLASAQTICQGSVPNALTLVGQRGTILNWESATNQAFTQGVATITNTTDTYTPPALNTLTCYRAVVKNGQCPSANSNIVCISVDLPSQGGRADSSRTVCEGSIISRIILRNKLGTVLRWERDDTGNDFTSGVTNVTNSAGRDTIRNQNLPNPGQVCFRAVVKNGACPEAYSTPACYTIDANPVAGTLANAQTICRGQNPTPLCLTGYDGTILYYTYSTDNFVSQDTIRITTDCLTFPTDHASPTVRTSYRAVVDRGACPNFISNTVVIDVDPPVVPGTLAQNQTLCTGTTANLTLTGNNGTIEQWEISSDNTFPQAQTTVTNTNSSTFTTPAITATRFVRVGIRSGLCPLAYSNVVTISVHPDPVAGTLSAPATVCANGQAPNVTLNLAGHSGRIVNWQHATDCNSGTWTDESPVNTTTSLTVPALAVPGRCYRVQVTNLAATCTTVISNTVFIQADALPTVGTLSATPSTVCSGASATLTLTGTVGTVTRWEAAADNTFTPSTNFSTQNVTTINPPAQTVRRCYRAWVSNGVCPEQPTNDVCVDVFPTVSGGSVSPSQTVCVQGGTVSQLTLSGHQGPIVRWEVANDNSFVPKTDISNVTTVHTPTDNPPLVRCYRAIIQAGGQCPEVASNPACITVDQRPNTGTLSQDQTVCELTPNATLTLTGFTTDIVEWRSASDRNFTQNLNTISHTQATLTVNPTTTTCYRAMVSNGVCPAEASNVVCVTVDLRSLAGTPTGAATICQGSSAGPLTLTGHRTDVLRWEFRIDAGNYNPIPSSANATLATTGPLTQAGTYCYRAVVQNGMCPSVNSNDVCIQVDATTIAGTLSPDNTVCRLANSGTLTVAGHNGTIQRWEQSTDGTTWTPAGGGTGTTFTYNNLQQTTFYHVVNRNGVCPEQTSNQVRIQVDAASNATQITGPNAACEGQNNGTLTLDIPNIVGTIQNWEEQPNCTGAFTPMNPVYTNPTFTYNNLAVTTCYRVSVKSGECPIATTPDFRVDVTPATIAGTVAPARTICLGQPTGDLTLSGQRGNVVRWEIASDCNFNAPIQTVTPNFTGITLNYNGLTTTSCFRSVVKNGGCPEAPSVGALVTVIQQPTPGQVTAPQTICFNSTPAQLNLTGHQGTILRWQSSTDGTNWTDIPSTAGLTSFTPPALTQNTSFRAVLEPQGGNGQCGERPSFASLITVDPATVPGTLSQNATLCISAPATGTLTLSGFTGTIQRWESSTDPTFPNGSTTVMGPVTNTVQYVALTTTTHYRVAVKSGVCQERFSNTVTIQVDQVPTVPLAGADQVICSNPGSTNLSGNVISVGSGLWSQVSGPNTATFTASNPTSAVSGMIAGIYVFRWTSSNGVCPPQSDDVSITVDQDPSAPNAGVDQTICQSTGQTVLAGSTPVPVSATGQWTIVSSPNGSSPVVVNPALGTSSLTGLSVAGQYTLRWTVRNGTVCASKSDDVVISVDPTTVSGVLGTSGTVCQNDNRTLTLTGQTGNVVRWEQNVNGGGWVQIGGATGTTYNIVGIQTTTSYRVVVRSGVCPEATTAAVTVTVDPTTVGGNVTTDATVCRDGNSGLVRLSGHVGTVQRWEISTDCATYTSLSNTSAVQTYVNLTQTTCYRAVVKSGVCLEQTSTPARITVVKPAVTGNHTDIRCFGETNGTITITPSGGFPFQVGQPYRYVWTKNGASFSTQQNLTNLGAGRYCVTVTDGINCPVSSCFTVTEPTLLTSSLVSLTNVSCNNANDGTINLNVSGGTPAYTFAWTRNGAAFGTSVEDLSGLNPGTYAVTITDANGCLNNLGPFTITQPSAIVSTTSYIRNVSCKGMSNGSIGHHVTGGTPPYTYLWSPGGMVTEDVERLVAGMYTVTITDATGCQLVKNFNVTEPFLLEIRNVQVMNTRCNGGSDGSIRLDVMGGTAPYFYMWSNGVQTEDLMNAPAGVYDLYVRDANGCVITQSFTIGTPELLTATISELRPVLCAQSSTGALRVNASGGVPPYSYLWNTGSTTDSTVSASAGGYSVSVRDSRGCLVVATYELKSPASLKVIDLQVTNVKCHGGNDGGLAIRVEGGDAHYTFIWSDGARVEDRTDLRGGNYTLTVTDGNGCTLVQTFTVPEPEEALRIVTNKVSEVSCSGVKDGSIDISVRGGVAPYNYLWSNGSKTEDLTGVGSGEYLLEIVDAWGCIVRQPYTLADVEPLVFAVNFVKEPTCFGRTDGAIGIQVSGGQQPYRYQWSSGQTSEDIENVGSGEYLITVTDARGCSKTLKHTLTAPPALKISVVRQTNPTCFGSSNGSIFVQVNGGAGNYTYSWSDGSVNQNLQNVPSGTYILVVRDGSGCSAEATYTLTSPSELKINTAIERSISCSGGNDGTLAIGVAGGVGPYQVEWRRGNTIIGNSLLITGLSAGNYAVKVSDNQGCFTEKAYSLTAPSALSLTVTGSSLNCTNSVDGTVSSSVSGGTPPYSYVWNTGTTASGLTNVGAGIYSLTVTDAKGCRITGSAEVLAPAGIVLKLVNKTHVTCKGLSDGTIEVIAEGGTGKLSYVWNVGFGGNMRSDLQAGVYSVTATDANGCTAVLKDILITQPANALTAKFTYIKESACGGVASGSIGLDVTGGVPPYVYAWSHGSGLEDPADLAPGIYTVTITDMNGCVKVMEAEVKGATEALRVESLLIRPVTCNGGTDGGISLDIRGGTQPYTYRWTNGSTVEDQPNLKAGVYRLEVRDAKNCLLVRSYEVTEALPLSIQADEIVASGCIGSGSVRVSVSGGQEPYTYRWNTGSEDRDLSGAVAGTYQLAVTDGLGCVRVLSVTIPALPTMTATIAIVRKETCFGTNDGVLDLRVNGGTAPYTYLWSNGSTTEDIANAGNGVHSVAITDATGCVIQATVDIPTAGRLTVSLGVKTDIRCNGMRNGLIGINITGGEKPYTYRWSNGSTQEDLTDLGSGIYSVTVRDARGCEATGRYEITEPTVLVVSESGVTPETCAGSKDGTLGVSVTGGVTPYNYVWNTGSREPMLTGIGGGSYTVTVSDANGCRVIKTMVLTSPQAMTVSTVSVKGANCNGGTNGSADVRINGGTQPYSFLWSNLRTMEDLVGVPAGVYTLTVTDANNCRAIHTLTVPTLELSNVKIVGLPSEVCSGGNAVTLTGSPAGGKFSGTGVTGNVFDPKDLTAGDYEVVYSGSLNGCLYRTTATVRVNARPVVTSIKIGNGLTSFCRTDQLNYVLSVVPTESGTTYVYSGRGVVNGRFNPSQAGSGVHSLTVVARNKKGCETRFSQNITVSDPAITNVIASEGTICSGGMSVLRASGAESYVWSPATGLNGTTGETVEARPTRTTTYTVTGITGGCRTSATVRVVVGTSVTVVISQNPTGSVCPGVPVTLRAVSPAVSYEWSPATGLNTNVGSIVVAQLNETTTYTVVATSATGCTSSAQVTVSVQASRVSATADAVDLCSGTGTTLRATGGSGSYLWMPGNMTGAIVPVNPTVTTTYTVRDVNGSNCDQAIVRINVNPTVSGGIGGLQDRYCLNSSPVVPMLLPQGGVLTVNGKVSQVFNPAQVGIGDHELIYRGTNGTCEYRFVRVVSVGETGSAQLLNVKDEYCVIGMPEVMQALPEGGVFTVNGQVTNVIDPRSLGLGTHEVRYSGTESNGCRYESVKLIQVKGSSVQWLNMPTELCLNAPPVVMNAMPNGGTWRVNGVMVSSFDPSRWGAGTHEVTYSGTDGPCTYSRTAIVRVTGGLVMNVTSTNPTSQSTADGSITIQVSGGNGVYSYSITGGQFFVNTNVFSGLSTGTYNIVVRDGAGCTANQTLVLTAPICGVASGLRVVPSVQHADVSWNGVNGAIGYTISWRKVGFNEPWRSTNVNGNSFRIVNLLPGVTYEVRIRTRCGAGLSEFTEIVRFTQLTARDELTAVETELGISVYPNPTKGEFRVDLSESVNGTAVLYDALGREVSREIVSGTAVVFHIDHLSSGIYTLKLTVGNTVKTIKVVRE